MKKKIYEANFTFFKTLFSVTKSLTQNWVKKDLDLHITKSLCLPIPYFIVATSLTPIWLKKVLICTSRTNGNKKIKITIHKNFEANILTSWYRFHWFWNFNPISDVIIAKIGSKKTQICILFIDLFVTVWL